MENKTITAMQRKMMDAVGHEAEVRIVGRNKSFIGKCIGFTQPLDNDPEIASVDIAVPNRFTDSGRSFYELFEDKIESITILD